MNRQIDGEIMHLKFQDDGSRDFWANMLMLFCLQTYYEQTHDQRVGVDDQVFSLSDEKFLTHYWQKMRSGDNLYSVYSPTIIPP